MSLNNCLGICIRKSCSPLARLYLNGVGDIAKFEFRSLSSSPSCLCSCLYNKRERKSFTSLSSFDSVKRRQIMCSIKKLKEKEIMKFTSLSNKVFSTVKKKDSPPPSYDGDNNNNNNNINNYHAPSRHYYSSQAEPVNYGSASLESEKDLINLMKSRFLKTNQYYDAVFVLGAMGSGKTKVINDEFRENKVFGQYAYVDTDEIMEQLQGFNENAVDKYYPVARKIAIYLTDWLLEQRLSFVAEGTCVKYLELEDYMIRLQDKGYSIKVYKVPIVPLEIILRRSRGRKRRCVADNVVESIYYTSQYGLNNLTERNKNSQLFKEMN